jgi:uncharacterized protein (DUF4415 family)
MKRKNIKSKSKRSVKQQEYKVAEASKSQTNWKQIKHMKNKDIDTSDMPELNESFWLNAAIGSPLTKQLISLRIDRDVVDWFRNTGPNYQTRINQILRAYMKWASK